jgi:PAS domain-containing protein
MANGDLRGVSRRQLLEEIERLRAALANHEELRATIHDLEVRREELQTQGQSLAESQRLLEQSRDAYAALFDFAPISYVIIDSTGTISDLNFAAESLFGIERVRAIGFPWGR